MKKILTTVARSIILLAVFWLFSAVVWNLPQIKPYREETLPRLRHVFDAVALPYRMMQLSGEPRDAELLIPIQGLAPKRIADTWGAPRSGGRKHEGIDMFAKRGTPVFSATKGYVLRVGTDMLGGNIVLITGPGGVRYYYAHLDSFESGMSFGKEVSTSTILGYVGTTGNASGTPSHLHFGMYKKGAENPYDLLRTRAEDSR